jgi:hypothetical protein
VRQGECTLWRDRQHRPQEDRPVPRVIAEERAHDGGVKLPSRLRDEGVYRLLVARRAPVGAGRRDRVERVGDGHDPSAQWNLLAKQARGVSRSVQALVVVAHDRGEF